MRSFLRSSPVAPQRSRALAEVTRLVWQGSSTAASVTVATAFHGCSARRAAAGRAPAGRGARSSQQSTTTAAGLGSATRIRSRSRGKTGAPLPRQSESSQRFAPPSQHRAPGRATGRHPAEQLRLLSLQMTSQRHPSSQGSTMVSATSAWRNDARWWRLLSWVLGTSSSISFAPETRNPGHHDARWRQPGARSLPSTNTREPSPSRTTQRRAASTI